MRSLAARLPAKNPLSISRGFHRSCLISPVAWSKFDAYVEGYHGPAGKGINSTYHHLGRGSHGVNDSARDSTNALRPQQLTALIQGCMHAWELTAFLDRHGASLNEVNKKLPS